MYETRPFLSLRDLQALFSNHWLDVIGHFQEPYLRNLFLKPKEIKLADYKSVYKISNIL